MSLERPHDLWTGVPAAGSLQVVSFTGRERLSAPFSFDVVVAGRDVDEARFPLEALGKAARLRIDGSAGPRSVRGVIASVRSSGKPLPDRTAWRLRLVPRLAALRHRKNSRIFQDMTVPDIVSAVLGEAGVAHRLEVRQAYSPRAYAVQHEETDLDFIHRLLAEAGIFYAFEHAGDELSPDGAEVLVLDDRAQDRPIDGDPRLLYRGALAGGALRLEEHHVAAFSRARSAGPRAYHRRDHDFERPLLRLEGTATAGEPPSGPPAEIYEHHGHPADVPAAQETTALEQLRRDLDVCQGESACPRLLPGRRFTLAEHEIAGHDGEYTVTGVEHEGSSADVAKEGEPLYRNRLTCVSRGVVPRPPGRARRFRQVLETAVVTGPPGQEVYTDVYGRVKVQFHWDRRGAKDERSSCWLRVAQAWAGTGWGFQFVPRVGMEVLVGFLGGDPDRPVVVGCLPDATHPPPHPLPENRAKSGIRTESLPGGGGYNEILFDDTLGGELLSLRAERNLTETALNDHHQSVGRDQSVTVAGRRTAEIRGDDALRVEGGQSCTIAGKSSVSVGGGQSARIAGARATTIAGDDTTRIAGGQTTMAGSYSHLLIGHGAPEGHGAVHVNGDYRIAAAGAIEAGAGRTVTLSCGESSIELTPGEIRIRSPKVTIVAGEELLARGKEHEIAATDHLEIRGRDIRLLAQEGQLLLDADARLNGAMVKLNSDRKKAEKKDMNEDGEEGTILFRVKPHFDVAPGDRLVAVIATPSGETVEAEVDANMEVELRGKKGDRFVLVDLRKGELPFGKRGA